MDSLCTLLPYVDTADITLKESCSCQDTNRPCFQLGVFAVLPLFTHILTCCDTTTEGLAFDFNQCIRQIKPDKDDCLAIYGAIHRTFDCGEGTVSGPRQLETKFRQDQREGHHDRQLETESYHEQQENIGLLNSKCI